MNPFTQGETSGGPSIHPEKRKRGRPRKDKTLKNIEPFRVTFGSDGAQSMVGQPVAGFIEASFDAGFLLTLRIGNSTTNLRGVVFKPEHSVPITPENDVAPHLQKIGGDVLSFLPENHSWTRYPKPAIVKAGTKHGSTTTNAASVTLFDSRDASQTTHLLALGDKDIHMVEPLSAIPPNRAMPVDQSYIVSPLPTNHQVSQGIQQQNSNRGTSSFGQAEKATPIVSSDTDNMTSQESSDEQSENGIDEELDVSGDLDLALDVKQKATNSNEIFPAAPSDTAPTTNLFSYGTGRMTDLLQAVQENIKDKQVEIAEQRIPSTSKVEFNELGTSATYPNN